MIKNIGHTDKKLFSDLNYLYFDNDNKFENEKFKIIERYQAPLEEIADVFYVVNYNFYHKFFIRTDSISYNTETSGDKHIDFINYVTSICRKIKIENILEDDNCK